MFKKNRFGRHFGTSPQPISPLNSSEFGSLGQRLQQVLQQRIAQPNRLQIRCAIREGVLLVLVEHLLHVEPDSQQTFLALEQTVRECVPELMASDSDCKVTTDTYSLPIRLYLRVAGYQQPYAFHSLTIETTPSPLPPQFERLANAGIAFPETSLSTPLRPETPSLENPAVETQHSPEAEPIAPIEPIETASTPEFTSVVESSNVRQSEPDRHEAITPEIPIEERTLDNTSEDTSEDISSRNHTEEYVIQESIETSESTETQIEVEESTAPEDIIEESLGGITEENTSIANLLEALISDTPIISEPEAITEDQETIETSEHLEILAEQQEPSVLEETAENAAVNLADEIIPETPIAEASFLETSVETELAEAVTEPQEPIETPESTETWAEIEQELPEDIAEETTEYLEEAEISEDSISEELISKELISEELISEAPNETESEEVITEHHGLREAHLSETIEFQPAIFAANIEPEATVASLEESGSVPAGEPIASFEFEPVETITPPIQPMAFVVIEESAQLSETFPLAGGDAVEAIELQIDTLETPALETLEIDVPELIAPELVAPEPVSTEFIAPEPDFWVAEPAQPIASETIEAETEVEEPIQPIASETIEAETEVEEPIQPIASEATEAEIRIEDVTPKTIDAEWEEPVASPSEVCIESPIPNISSDELATDDIFQDESTTEIDADLEESTTDYDLTTETEDLTNPVVEIELYNSAQEFFTEVDSDQETNGHRNDLEILEEFTPTSMTQTTDQRVDQPENLSDEFVGGESSINELDDESFNSERFIHSTSTSESFPQNPKPTQVSPLLIHPAHRPSSNSASSSLDRLPLEVDREKRRSMPSLATMMLSGAVGLFFVVSGAYVITRPCVLGNVCQPLEQSQQLSQRALTTIQNNPEALEVVDAYDQLTQAIEQLKTIPSWSKHHQTAQTLIAEYSSKAEVLGTVVQALNQANTATRKSLNPPHPVQTWREIQFIWRDAISTLEKIPADSPVYALSQSKLQEYRSNLDSINHRIVTEQDAQQRLDQVKQAANVTEARSQIVNSTDSWQQTITSWTTLLDQLQQIPQGTSAYTEAQRLLTVYGLKLENAENQLSQAQLSTSAYTEASNLAEQARQAEQQSNWSQSVALWRDAITALKKIPEGTAYYSQAQTLLQPYTTSLNQSESNLKRITLTQTVQPQLDRLCIGIPLTCTFTIATEAMRVQLTPGYDQLVKQVLLSSQLQGNSNVRADVAGQINQFLQSLGAVSQSAQVPLELYDSTGSRFATYDPVRGGYIAQ